MTFTQSIDLCPQLDCIVLIDIGTPQIEGVVAINEGTAASVKVIVLDLVGKHCMMVAVVHIRFAFVLVTGPKPHLVYLLVTLTENTAETLVNLA